MLTRKQYKVGQTPRLSVTFADAAGTPTDPTTVTFTITEPDEDATVTTYVFGTDAELVNSAVGEYYVEFEIVNAGTHCYAFTGTGALKAYDDRQFVAVGACA